jgi:hypothetical protein
MVDYETRTCGGVKVTFAKLPSTFDNERLIPIQYSLIPFPVRSRFLISHFRIFVVLEYIQNGKSRGKLILFASKHARANVKTNV